MPHRSTRLRRAWIKAVYPLRAQNVLKNVWEKLLPKKHSKKRIQKRMGKRIQKRVKSVSFCPKSVSKSVS